MRTIACRMCRFVQGCSTFAFQGLRRGHFRYTTILYNSILLLKFFRASGEAILGTQRYFITRFTYAIYLRDLPTRFIYAIYLRDLLTRFIYAIHLRDLLTRFAYALFQALYPSILTKHFIKAHYQNTLSKHFVNAFLKACQKYLSHIFVQTYLQG